MPRQKERYCVKLVSEALGGAEYKSGHTFPFLRGDPTPKRKEGTRLPVDAYFPTFNIVLEFRESQHYANRVEFWDKRITATGQPREQQRKLYDERRERILPAHGINLIIIYDYELTGERIKDLDTVKQKLK
jgi:hypothetical protein